MRGRRYSIALDYWSDMKFRPYLGVVCTTLAGEGPTLRRASVALACKYVENKSEESTVSALVEIIEKAHLSLSDMIQVVSDGGDSASARSLAQRGAPMAFFYWCGAHLLNLVQRDALKLPVVDGLMNKLGPLIRYFRTGDGRSHLQAAEVAVRAQVKAMQPADSGAYECTADVNQTGEDWDLGDADVTDVEWGNGPAVVSASDEVQAATGIDHNNDAARSSSGSRQREKVLEVVSFVVTRWTSLARSLDRIVRLRRAIHMIDLTPNLLFTDVEWNLLE